MSAGTGLKRCSPEELRSLGLQLFGEAPGWQSRLAETLGYDRSTITRWLAGTVPMPLHASLLVRYVARYGPPTSALA